MFALVNFYIGFIIDSIKDITSSDRPYFVQSCWSISETLFPQSMSDLSVKSCNGTNRKLLREIFIDTNDCSNKNGSADFPGFSKVIETFENHNETIINYFEERLTNASAESFNAKIKAFRTQFRGVGDVRFFMYRLATLYS